MPLSSGSTLQQTDDVEAVASGSGGSGGRGGGVSTWDGLGGELSGPVPFDATDGDGNPTPRGANFLNSSVEVRWERDPANGVALRVRDVTSGSDLLETDEGGLTDVPALNIQDTLTIPEKGDGAGQYIGDADFQLGDYLARDTATDPDTLDVTLQAGTNITIESDGTINATGGTGSPTDILEGGTEVVADATDVDFASGDFEVTNPSGSEAAVALADNTVTVAGNSVPLGGSTAIGHGDLSGIGSDDHHVKTTSASDLSDVSADSVSDAHHAVFEPADYNPVSDVEAHGDALAIDITGNADTLDGVEGSNYARTDQDEGFEGIVTALRFRLKPGDIRRFIYDDYKNREKVFFQRDLSTAETAMTFAGTDVGFGGETAPSYAVDVDGRAQATTLEATDTLLIPEK